MKTLLVIFAIICVSYAFVDVDEDDAVVSSSTTESPTDKPPVEVSTLPPPLNDTKTGTINGIGTVFFEIPVQKSQGIVLTITTNKKIALLFVSLDSNNQSPNADKSDYSVACYGDNSFTAQIQIPSNKFDAPTKAPTDFLADATADAYISVIIQGIATDVTYILDYKPYVTVPPTTTTAVPTIPTTQKSSSTMLVPTFLNFVMLIFFYKYFSASN